MLGSKPIAWVSSEEASGRNDKGEIRFANQSENEIVNDGPATTVDNNLHG